MTTKALQARENAGLFLDPATEQALPKKRSQRRVRAGTQLVDGIVNGERVLLHTPTKEPLERAIELRIRAVLATKGIIVWKHVIEVCHVCGTRPSPRTGLGRACADLICIVPPLGRVLAIEVKRPSKRNAARDAHQRHWAAVVRRHGGIAGIATCEAEALALLAEARAS